MAYIDPYTGQQILTPEEEEEKRKREQEIANTAVQTEERKVYGDGTQEIITKREIPPEPAAEMSAPMAAPIDPSQPQPTAPPAPQFDRNTYNASIAQQESSNRPNIGYHDRNKSSAFGLFGITNPAYQDARRKDPSLPADIAQANQEQQTRAQNILTDNNARFLQQRGVEATPGVLSAAHFVGANGLHKYLTQKDELGRPYISPQAQAANGGYEKSASIIIGRLNGQAVPASAAAQQPPANVGSSGFQAYDRNRPGNAAYEGAPAAQPQPQPAVQAPQVQAQPQAPISPEELARQQYNQSNQGIRVPGMMQGQPAPQIAQTQSGIDRYQAAQDDPLSLIQLRSDTSQPAFIRQRAGLRVAEMITSENNKAAAEAALPALSQNELARVATKKSEGNSVGDWMQYLLYKHVGLNDLANQKGEQLGIGHKWIQTSITDAAGNDLAVELQTTASGKVLSGNRLDGTPLTAKELNAAGGTMGGKDYDIVGGTFVNDKTGEVGTVYRSKTNPNKQFVQTDTGRKPLTGFRPQTGSGTAADQRLKLIQDMNIKLQGKTLEQQMLIQQDYSKLLVGQGLAPLQPNDTPLVAPQIAGGQPIGTSPTGQSAAPGTAVAPTGQAIAPAAPGAAAVAGQRPTASQIAATAEAQKQEAQEVGMDIGKIRTGYGKSVDDATRLIRQAEELITDPGFEVSVGASVQPFFQNIPGSDRATWNAKHQEVIGQQFTEAIKALKGLGAMSDKEGDAAQAAISRLKNTDQNEESFKAGVKELQSLIKRGVERNAEKLGKEKPDWNALMKAGTTESSAGTTSSGNKFKKVQ